MKKEFLDKVRKLFHDMVRGQEDSCHTASHLIDILNSRVTRPIRITTVPCSVPGSVPSGIAAGLTSTTVPDAFASVPTHLITYYNVSITLADDMSEMTISYNSDYSLTFHKLEIRHPHQIADFIIALERDIPQWKYIWTADNALRKERATIADKINNTLRSIRNEWINLRGNVTQQQVEAFRIRFYNIKAQELMLQNGNPFWKKRNTEEEILAQCQLYHILPPIEQWCDEWEEYSHERQKEVTEQERQRQELRDRLSKTRHLIKIKHLKIDALLNTVEFHPSVRYHVTNSFPRVLHKLSDLRYGAYLVTIGITQGELEFTLRYNQVDKHITHLIDIIKQINDLVPQLFNTMHTESHTHKLYIEGQGESYSIIRHSASKRALYLVDAPCDLGQIIPKQKAPQSYKILDKINTLFYEMADTLNHDKTSEI